MPFPKDLEPEWDYDDYGDRRVIDLVPSLAGSPSGFINSIVILLSSSHSTMIAAGLSFLHKTASHSSPQIQYRLVESDLVFKVLAIVQPHTLPISENGKIIDNLIWNIVNFLDLAHPFYVSEIGLTIAVDAFNHREMIFQKVVFPSSELLTFLISNRNLLNRALLCSFMNLLNRLLEVGPFHRPTLEYLLASPIVMAFSSCLSIVEDGLPLSATLNNIKQSLKEWKKEGAEVVQSGKRMMQALFSEGFEDRLEQMSMRDRDRRFRNCLIRNYRLISELMGTNVKNPR
ncbi:hypothetical protein BLNAU_21620 [Blattamonas nauphoetae]|uniref:Uncharacterized protein n=1 Tax=Blattamonas nauphoetae TaxID=2049346 RepID=A0ABQ9WXL1_9EUKA|nr:hypothetical protein BLNAU_21620 [Blattamonas nauphoetae]